MTNLRKAAEMALDALHNIDQSNNYDAIEALRQALAQPDDFVYSEDKSYRISQSTGSFGIGDTSPKREWVGLTDEEIETIWQNTSPYYDHQDFARDIEAKLKEKNGG